MQYVGKCFLALALGFLSSPCLCGTGVQEIERLMQMEGVWKAENIELGKGKRSNLTLKLVAVPFDAESLRDSNHIWTGVVSGILTMSSAKKRGVETHCKLAEETHLALTGRSFKGGKVELTGHQKKFDTIGRYYHIVFKGLPENIKLTVTVGAQRRSLFKEIEIEFTKKGLP